MTASEVERWVIRDKNSPRAALASLYWTGKTWSTSRGWNPKRVVYPSREAAADTVKELPHKMDRPCVLARILNREESCRKRAATELRNEAFWLRCKADDARVPRDCAIGRAVRLARIDDAKGLDRSADGLWPGKQRMK